MSELLKDFERNCKSAGRHKLVCRLCDYMLENGKYSVSADEIRKVALEIDEEEKDNARKES